MYPSRTFLALLVAVLLLCAGHAAAPPGRPLPSQIARWIEELGDDSFAIREATSKKLREAGDVVEPALEQATRNPDAEIAKRARTILADFRWGIYPDTPPAIVELVRNYQAAARSEKRDVIRKMLAAGAPGCRALAKIARAEEDPLVRQEVFTDIASGLGAALPGLLEAGNRPALEGLLEVALAGNPRTAASHYAAYHLLTGQLSDRIREWEARARKAVVPKAENEILAYLYRASADLPRAGKAASIAERLDLLEAILYEQADWKELARQFKLPETEDTVRYISYRCAYGRLAGVRKVYEDAIEDLRKRGEGIASMRGDILPYAKGLFLNARADLALQLLQKSQTRPVMIYEILSSQSKLEEAFALVQAARKAGSSDLAELELLEARTLYLLGEKGKALETLKRYTAEIKPGPTAKWYLPLIEAEIALGRRDQAYAVAAKTLAATTDSDFPWRVFEKLLDRRGPDGRTLWTLLQTIDPKAPVEKRLSRWRSLLEGKATEKEVRDLLEAVKTPPVAIPPGEAAENARVLAEVCVANKQPHRAADLFREAGTPPAWIRQGDLLVEKKQWLQAATQFLAAYKLALKERSVRNEEGEGLPALALFLSGHALEEAGRVAEGRARKEQAHLLPLGDCEMRFDLIKALRKRGHREAVRREQDYLRRLGEPGLADPGSYYTGEGLRTAAIDAANRKDWLRAADGYEQTFLRCLQPTMNFTRPSAYVTVPAHIYAVRARGLMKAGKLDEALAEAERARTSQPGSVDLACRLVPELEKQGRKKEADKLYRDVVGVYETVLRDYPNAAWASNQAAWLSACCRRDLAQGLKHARKAVESSPDSASYLDTLAEVLFQLGKKDEAIQIQKKAIALVPTREYFRKQLKRLEAGDPRAPRPEEEE